MKRDPTSRRAKRSWTAAGTWSVVVVGIFLGLAVGINVLIGRYIHWDIVAAIGAGGLPAAVFARRYGYV